MKTTTTNTSKRLDEARGNLFHTTFTNPEVAADVKVLLAATEPLTDDDIVQNALDFVRDRYTQPLSDLAIVNVREAIAGQIQTYEYYAFNMRTVLAIGYALALKERNGQ